jgi:hypothetical protein
VTPPRRSPPRGPAGDSDDLTLQETIDLNAAGIAVKDRAASGPLEDDPPSLAERFTDWRRHYLPLPDEVVTEYLGEDEYVIHSDHPSFRAFLIKNSIQVTIATLMLPVVFAFVKMDLSFWYILLIVLGLDLVLLVLAIKRLGDRYTSYVITNLRLIRVSGIISRRLASIPWTRMTGLGYRQKAVGRLMGFATIFIESANEESGLREFSDINDPAAFHRLILDMVSAKGGPKPDKPTKGVRRTLWQRRKDAREAMRKANEAAIAEAQDRDDDDGTGTTTVAEPQQPVPDAAGPAEAMSTSDDVPAPRSKVGFPPKQSAPRRPQQPPRPTITINPPNPPRSRASVDPPPDTPPRGTPRIAPGRPPGRPPSGSGTPSRPQGPRSGDAIEPPSSPSRQRLAGGAGSGGGSRTRPVTWPGGTRNAPANPISEPWLSRVRKSPLVQRLFGGARRTDVTSAGDERVSARDALGAVSERGGRFGRVARGRPRFPTFGRSRPPIPPSRQLPAGSNDPSDDED